MSSRIQASQHNKLLSSQNQERTCHQESCLAVMYYPGPSYADKIASALLSSAVLLSSPCRPAPLLFFSSPQPATFRRHLQVFLTDPTPNRPHPPTPLLPPESPTYLTAKNISNLGLGEGWGSSEWGRRVGWSYSMNAGEGRNMLGWAEGGVTCTKGGVVISLWEAGEVG
eukprot:507006-Hanusia_phi.AAC.2